MKQRLNARRTVLVAVVAVLGGAGPSAAATTATPEALAHAFCAAVQTLPAARKALCCGGSPTDLAGECMRTLRAALRARAITLDPTDVARCAAHTSAILAGCDWITPYQPRTPPACHGLLHGQLTVGARCRSSLECRDGLACRGGTPSDSGVCAPPGAPGAPCGGVPDALATYARQGTDDARHPECDGYCVRGRCTPSAPPGGSCSSDLQCATGSHCTGQHCFTGPRPALGESCTDTTCAGELACIEGRCAPPGKAGAACAQSSECEGACLSGTCGMQCSALPHPISAAPTYPPHQLGKVRTIE